MDTRSLCQLCLLIVIFFLGVTEAAWTLTGSSEFAVAGDSFTLTCNPQDSNALGIKWKRLNIDTTTTDIATIEADGCKVGKGSDTQYQYTCEPGPIYKLTIPANVMTNSQNNIVWRCEFVFGGAGKAADYTVTVAVPVSSISIQESPTGNQQVNNILVYDNIQKTIYCITNGCRPKANVTITTTGVSKGQFTEDFIPQNGDLTITRVSQLITTTRGGSTTKTIQCSAVNIQGRQSVISQLATIVVYYPPTTPTLQTFGARFPWVENTQGVLKCVTTAGFPTATTYDWIQNGQVINGQTSETFTIPTLSNIHNGLQIQCRVSNEYTTQRPPTSIISKTVILDVQCQRSEGKPQIATHYEDISQTNQETSVYEGINTDHENQNKSSGVDTYESLGSTTSAEIKNTYQSLEKTESPGSEGISIELYENTKIN